MARRVIQPVADLGARIVAKADSRCPTESRRPVDGAGSSPAPVHGALLNSFDRFVQEQVFLVKLPLQLPPLGVPSGPKMPDW
jgi:hypothetical protein